MEHIRAYGLLSSVQDEFSTVLAYLRMLGMPKSSEAGDSTYEMSVLRSYWTCRCWVCTATQVLSGSFTCISCCRTIWRTVCRILWIIRWGSLKQHSSCLRRLCLGRRSHSVSLAFFLLYWSKHRTIFLLSMRTHPFPAFWPLLYAF